jgi:hypothetical protein
MRLSFLAIVSALLLLAGSADAQHAFVRGGTYDPAVPTPAAVLGYEIGQRFTPHHMIVKYAERVAGASRRIRVDTVARTFEGRESLRIVATSDANMGRLEQIRASRQSSGWATPCTEARPPAPRPRWGCCTSWRPALTPRPG